MAGKNWTDDQRYAALSLYFELEFGQFDQRNKKVIALSQVIGRSPSAVAFKLGNYANLDPTLDRKGFSNVSKADRELIERFHRSPERVVAEMARAIERCKLAASIDINRVGASDHNIGMEEAAAAFDVSGRKTTATAEVTVRRGQSFFRDAVLTGYKNRCCVCGLSLTKMLEAAHIIDHSASDQEIHRLRPDNGLSLCRNHHRAFDCGCWTLDENYRVEIDHRMHSLVKHDQRVEEVLTCFDGKDIFQPFRYLPSKEYIAWHRENRFAQVEPVLGQ
ncbi:HNH endonuclease [Thalassospira sp.]|uniref:HNH endonuclease n=1 Tax=Thalassospira sp. TaxID=1912094 RepID=UPI000C3B645E|nr:HNH endonuclease [Thalassospira sp.]MBC08469.1 hypothetical protein [Thalassospira sp.]